MTEPTKLRRNDAVTHKHGHGNDSWGSGVANTSFARVTHLLDDGRLMVETRFGGLMAITAENQVKVGRFRKTYVLGFHWGWEFYTEGDDDE